MKNNKLKVLITGSSGMLGADLVQVFKDNNFRTVGLDVVQDSSITADKFYQEDLCNQKKIEEILFIEQPDVIIYSAAIVSLKTCQENKELANCIHSTAPERIASLKRRDTKFFYISSDSVFDGKRGNYAENDQPNPLNYYAESKMNGEKAVLGYENSIVVRTNIFGYNRPLKNSLAEWAVKNLQENKKIIGFDDVIFNAIYTYDLAVIICKLALMEISGIINIAGKGVWSKYEFLVFLAKTLNYNAYLIDQGTSADFDFKISRPLKTNLNTSKIESLLQIPSLEESLINFCNDFKMNNYENWKYRTGKG